MGSINMPWDRYESALARFRAFVANGRPLALDDSDDIGNKHTHCSWGLCEDGPVYGAESWPDPQDHLWPDRFQMDGRLAPKYRQNEQWCPFDRRLRVSTVQPKDYYELGTFGCFFHCRFFSPKGPKPTREEALNLYDVAIARVKARK